MDVKAQLRTEPPSCYDVPGVEHQSFGIHQYGAFYALESAGAKFAVSNKKICQDIHRFLDTREILLRAFVPGEEWARIVQCWRKQSISTTLSFDLNLYGSRHRAVEVGRILSSAQIYLQRPLFGLDGCIYYNPHYLHAEEILGGHASETPISILNAAPVGNPQQVVLNQEQQRNESAEIDSILNSLSHHHFLGKSAADHRIKTPLLE